MSGAALVEGGVEVVGWVGSHVIGLVAIILTSITRGRPIGIILIGGLSCRG